MLAIEVTHRGFAFVVLEGSERLIDWGGRDIEGDTSVFLMRLRSVIDRYRPDALVLEEPAGSAKGGSGKQRLAWSEQMAHDRDLRTVVLPRTLRSKDQVGEEMICLFPELEAHLPKPRKWWNSEARGIAKFAALERALRAIELLEHEDRSKA